MWTERIGFIAALETLKKMKSKNVQNKIVKNGLYVKRKIFNISKKLDLKINIKGMDSMPSFSFNYKNQNELYTFFTQEMLSLGFLATNSMTLSYAHDKKTINNYLNKLEKTFKKIKILIESKSKIPLRNVPRQTNFTRQQVKFIIKIFFLMGGHLMVFAIF